MSTINSVSSLVSSLQQQISTATSTANNSNDFSSLLQGIQQVLNQASNATTTSTNTSTAPATPSVNTSTNTDTNASTATTTTPPVTSNSPTGEKPSLKDFMAMTGADTNTAVKYLYGSVGAFTDYRDWSAINASSNPLQATQQATSDMFVGANAPSQAAQLTQAGYQPVPSANIIAQQNQLALVQNDQQSPSFQLINNEGFAFSSPLAPSDMNGVSDQMQTFGVASSSLNNLLSKLDQSKQALPANYPESTWTQLLSRLNVTWSNGGGASSTPA